jgi:hypothetical protein
MITSEMVEVKRFTPINYSLLLIRLALGLTPAHLKLLAKAFWIHSR